MDLNDEKYTVVGCPLGVNSAMINFIQNDVISFVNRHILPVTSKPNNPLQIVCEFTLEKCTKSIKAVCELCAKDYGEDALIIARSIYEHSLTLAYICKPDSSLDLAKIISSDELARMYILHGLKDQLSKQKQISRLNQEGKCKDWEIDIQDYRDKKQVTEDNKWVLKSIEDLDKLLPKSNKFIEALLKIKPNGKSWNSLSLKNTAAIVGEPYDCDYHFIYWSVSQLVHSSTLSGLYYAERPDSPDASSNAVLFGYNYYSKLLHNTNNIFTLGQEKNIQDFEDKFVAIHKKSQASGNADI